MKDYFCIWHYIANYGTIRTSALNPSQAVQKVLNTFSDDFKKKATVYVMREEPYTSTPADRIKNG